MSLFDKLKYGTVFYENLLEKLQSTFSFDLIKFLDPNTLPPQNLSKTVKLALVSCQRTMICLGDIARYKEQSNDGGKVNYAKARNWYTKAQQIAPKNGRPYNQLAILALYTKHKLDAVYYYMRSLAASNPFLTARESLMSLFNEARKKAEVNEKLRFEERKKQEGLRKHRNVREHRVEIWIKNDGTSSESKVDDTYDEDLSKLDTVQLNKRFVLSFLNVHGKLFTKIGMEMFPDSCGQMLQEFKVLLKDNAIGPQRLLQLMAINMFAIENTALKDESLESTCKSLLQQHSVQMGLDMFGILVERCAQLLAIHIKSDDYPGRMFSRELEELVPGIKVWTNWMICHSYLWNPPPQVRDPAVGPDIDVWSCTATLCNILQDMDTSQTKFFTEKSDDMEPVILSEDMMMSGFVPLLTTPLSALTSTFVQNTVDKDLARDCLRVEKLRVFGEYLCGVEPPMLAYSAETKKYYSVAPSDGFEDKESDNTQEQQGLSEEEDVVIEDEEIVHMEDTDDHHVQHLKARKEELEKRMEEKKRLHEHRKRVVETNRHSCIEIEIRPIFLIPDTNCFIDHLPSLKKLIDDRQYTIVIPLVVINELDGLAQGQKMGQYESEDHASKVRHRAANTIELLEKEFEKKNSHLKALTSKGSVMETISFRSEETDASGNNDDLILSCCTYYCKDKARDYMPKDKDTPVRLYREVVLLTDDRNLRLKAHTHNVPVKEIPAFMKWSSST